MVNDHCIGHKHIIFLQEEESVEEEQPVEIQLEELVEIMGTNVRVFWNLKMLDKIAGVNVITHKESVIGVVPKGTVA